MSSADSADNIQLEDLREGVSVSLNRKRRIAMNNFRPWIGLGFLLLVIPLAAQSQSYSRTESIAYHDNTTKWVLGQTAEVKCVAPTTALPVGCGASGTVISQTTYDATYARPLTIKSFGKLQQTLTYDTTSTVVSGQLGTVKTVADGNNSVTTLSNWKRGTPQTIQYPGTPESPAGATRSAIVDDNGWIMAVTDENGFVNTYGYDAMGRMSSIVYPTGDSTAWNTVTMAFQQINADEHSLPAGHWRQSRYQGNKHVNTYYDAMWRPVLEEQLDYANIGGTLSQTVKRYDVGGRLAFQSNPTANVGDFNSVTQGMRTTYDALDRVVRIEQDSELGVLTTTTEYLTGFKTRVTPPKGQPGNTAWQTTITYMAYDTPTFDLPVTIQEPEGRDTTIVRDIFGKPTALNRGGNGVIATRNYVYQADQQLCKTIEPEIGATVYGYDGASNLIQSASGLQGYGDLNSCNHPQAWTSGRVVNRTYDARSRLKTLSFPDGNGNQSWDYTPDGLPSLVTTTQANVVPTTNTYSYNKRRLLTNEQTSIAGAPLSLGYTYDGNGSLSVLTYPNTLTVSYAPNALGQATQAGSYATSVQYYPNGAVKQFTYGNGLTHNMSQNARQLPSRVTDGGNALDFEYLYDKAANVSAIYDYVIGTPTPQHRWMGYDGLDRLRWASSVMFGVSQQFNYTYDALDNLKSAKLEGVKDYANYVYDPVTNLLTNIKNSSGATIVGIGYDVQGNVSNKNGANFGFDYGNRLRGSDTEWYAYDAHGRRILSCNATACDYQQYASDGNLYFHLDYRKGKRYNNIYLAGSVVAIREAGVHDESNPQLKYQHTDALGSPVAVTDAAGSVIDRTNYEPYGAALNEPTYDGIGYTGHVMDSATSLTYMQQRYYDPQIGRFLSVDPVMAGSSTGANFNRYRYANNNPYLFTDPDGRQAAETIRELILPTSAELVERGESGTAGTNTVGALKQVGNTALQTASLALDPIGTFLRGGAPQIPIHNNELEGAAATELGVAVFGALAGGGGTGAGLARNGAGLVDDGARALAGSGKNWIYSARELIRRASEPGPFHNFPESFNKHIFAGNREIISNSYILYTRPGMLNGKTGAFQIGVRPSPSGRTEIITHRFFRPD